jgi:glutathione S-transferase
MMLYMHPVSTTSRPIVHFCAENGIDLELRVVDLLTGEHIQEPYSRDINPSKQVPTLDDDGFLLTESSAILKYLADKIDSPAYPRELKVRARVNEAMDWFNTGFYREYGYHLVYPQVYPHHVRNPEDANRVTVEWGKEQSKHWLAVLDKHFLGGGKEYVCGDDLTLADYLGAAYLSCGDLVGDRFDGYPNVQRWLEQMRSMPKWNEVNETHNGFAASLRGKPFVAVGT